MKAVTLARLVLLPTIVLAVLGLAPVAGAQPSPAKAAATSDTKIDARLLALSDGAVVDFWVTFRAQADLGPAAQTNDWDDRGQVVVDRLHQTADASQAGVTNMLTARGIEHESYWIANTSQVTGSKNLMRELAARPEVEQVVADRTFELPRPTPSADLAPTGLEWNVSAVNAPAVWDQFSATGQGIVVANLDTGVQFDHPALVRQYRGNLGGSFDHNYNWFDPSRICGNPSTTPCDNEGHGTHTMGTMVGADQTGQNQVGVAPGATWIAVKGCEYNSCSLTALLTGGQWLLAPTDLDGQSPRPDLRPNVVNNSWGGPGQDIFFQDVVSSWVAAGIFPVFSNGNSGPGCGTAGSPADYLESYAVGAHDSAGAIAFFSSRGSPPGLVKPDIAAPGSGVRSSLSGNSYGVYSGTSMAAPHVAGTVALMWSAAPSLVADVAGTKEVLDATAVDVADATCGGTAADNGVWGQGRLDAMAAVDGSPRGPVGTLAGTIVNQATGEPVGGAQIRSVGAEHFPRATRTDPGGLFRQVLPVGTHEVTVSAFGYATRAIDVVVAENAVTVADVSLVSHPRHGVSGTILDADGVPVEAALVSIVGVPVAPVATDASGSFRFAGIPDGNYEVSVSAGECVADARRDLLLNADAILDFVLGVRRDDFGYSCRSKVPAYIEAGNVVSLTGDDSVAAVPLPFPFRFYGTSYVTAQVSTNGVVGLAQPDSSFSNGPIPGTTWPNGAIYAFWDDLYVDADSSIRTATLGTEPNLRFVIEWRNVRFYGGPNETRLDFEVVLDQAGGILLQYRRLTDDSRVRGASATIGVENASGTTGLAYSHNEAALPGTQVAVRFEVASGFPTASNDAATTPEETPVTVAVLANDVDPQGDPLDVDGVSPAQHGTVLTGADDTITYTPAVDFNGSDTFSYSINDGQGGYSQANVTITVSAVNDAPRSLDDSANVLQDGAVTVAVLSNDSDVDGDELNVVAVSDPSHGSAVVNADRTVTYRPDAGYRGSDSFTYDAGDGHGGVTRATVLASVRKPMTAQVPLSVWVYPQVPNLDGVGNWVVPSNQPTASPGQMAPEYYYAHSFWSSDRLASGAVALRLGPEGTQASFWVTRADGSTDGMSIAYPWVAGRAYFLLVHHIGGGQWGAWVFDDAQAATLVGILTLSPQQQTLLGVSLTHVSWAGSPGTDCTNFPLARAYVTPTIGFLAGQMRTALEHVTPMAAADCGATTQRGPGWIYYEVGAT